MKTNRFIFFGVLIYFIVENLFSLFTIGFHLLRVQGISSIGATISTIISIVLCLLFLVLLLKIKISIKSTFFLAITLVVIKSIIFWINKSLGEFLASQNHTEVYELIYDHTTSYELGSMILSVVILVLLFLRWQFQTEE